MVKKTNSIHTFLPAGSSIIFLGFLLMTLSAGSAFYAFGLFMIPFQEAFDWGRSEISGAISIHFLSAGLGGPIAGKLMDRYPNRIIIITGLLLCSMSYFILPGINSLIHLYLLWGILGVGNALAGAVPVGILISRQFDKSRGIAMGLAMSGIAFGGLVMAPINGYLIENFEWQNTANIIGSILIIIPIPFVIFLIKNNAIGLKENNNENLDGFLNKIPAAIKTPSFWLAGFAFFLASAATVGVIQHQASFLRDYEMTASLAALGVGISAGIGGIGKLLFGYISDKLPVRYACLLSFASSTFALTILLTTQVQLALWIYIVFFGLGMGAIVVLLPLLVGELFGNNSFGTLYGTITAIQGFGLAFGPWAAGVIFDINDSYAFAFQCAIAMYIIATFMLFLTRKQILNNQ